MPYRYARAAAGWGPSVRARELCLGSSAIRGRTVAAPVLPLPLAQAPQVAADLPGIDLAPGQVQVRAGHQPLLVAGERHPLGQDVVGVGEPRAAVGAVAVGELDAVLAEQLPRLRQGGGAPAWGGEQGRAGERRAAGTP